jgi:hypothetical protein
MTRYSNWTLSSKLVRAFPLIGVSVSILAFSTAASAQRSAAHAQHSSKTIFACEGHKGGTLYIARSCRGRDRRVVWNAVGPQGIAGAPGSAGPQGQAGATGATGAQGPGAALYTYDSTAPAATEQNTPLGAAGPFSSLTGSCTVSGKIVAVVLGAVNTHQVTYDQTRTEITNGGTTTTTFQTAVQPASSTPADLLGEANSTSVGDGYNHTSMIVTDPVHGDLEVFEHVSHAANTCHISVIWTPAG